MKQFYDQIRQQLKQDEPEMIELLKRIVNVDSETKMLPVCNKSLIF